MRKPADVELSAGEKKNDPGSFQAQTLQSHGSNLVGRPHRSFSSRRTGSGEVKCPAHRGLIERSVIHGMTIGWKPQKRCDLLHIAVGQNQWDPILG